MWEIFVNLTCINQTPVYSDLICHLILLPEGVLFASAQVFFLATLIVIVCEHVGGSSDCIKSHLYNI
jgi:hypothetical protein